MDSMNNMVTTREASGILNLAWRTVKKWCKKLGFPKWGRDYLLTSEQMKLINENVKRGRGRPRIHHV